MSIFSWKFIPVHYFLNGQYLGTGEQPEEFHGKQHRGHHLWFWAPQSWFLYCPCCGEVWARGMSEHENARHLALKTNCAEHGGGSLIMSCTDVEWEGIPKTKELMTYELDLYCRDPQHYKARTSVYAKC